MNQNNLCTPNHHINRRRPSVLENIERIAAEIVGGVPGDRSSIVWPKANRNAVPDLIRRQHRKPFIPPPILPPSWCQNLKYEIASGPRKREKLGAMKGAIGSTHLEYITVEDAVELLAAGRGNPHLHAVRDRQRLHKTDTVGNREEWLSFPVRVIGDNRVLKRKRRKDSESGRKK